MVLCDYEIKTANNDDIKRYNFSLLKHQFDHLNNQYILALRCIPLLLRVSNKSFKNNWLIVFIKHAYKLFKTCVIHSISRFCVV